jgi:hypothetical protein
MNKKIPMFIIGGIFFLAIMGLVGTGLYIRNLGHQAFGDYGSYISNRYGDTSTSQSWFKGFDNIESLFLGSGMCFGVSVTLFAWIMSIALTKKESREQA